MRLDHVSYAVSHDELVDTIQRLGADLGASFVDGGRHPRFGTQNFILPLQGNMYIEVVAALDHPAAEQAAFGHAVRNRANTGGGWLGWVVAVEDIAPFAARIGRDAVAGHRRRPDGHDLQWHQVGVKDLMEDPQLPFFIQWESPAAEHPSRGCQDVRISRSKSQEMSTGWRSGWANPAVTRSTTSMLSGWTQKMAMALSLSRSRLRMVLSASTSRWTFVTQTTAQSSLPSATKFV